MVYGLQGINLLAKYPQVSAMGRVYLGVNLLAVVVLLFYNYRHAVTPGTRSKIRLLALGGGITGVSIVSMTILPDALFHQPILPYYYAFLLLGLFPLTYGFAIYRYHLIEIDRHVNRGATYILIYSLLGGSYLILYAWVNSMISMDAMGFPWVNTLLALFLVFLFSPVRITVQKFVDTIFYGGWYDYRQGVMQITQGLEQVSDLNSLARMISERLATTFKLEESSVFLRGPDGSFSVIEAFTRSTPENKIARDYPVLPRSSLTFLLNFGAVERNNLKKTLAEVSVTPDELQLLNSEQIHLWVPVVGHEQILGLLALGPKIGGDVFSGEDLDILRVLARQMGPVIENLHLLMRLRQHAFELEQRVRERTEELYDAKERVEAILASVGDGVIVTDLDGNIIRVNAAYEKQSGFTSDEIIGSELNSLLALDGKVDLFSDIKSALENEGIWNSSLGQKHKSGKNFDVQLTVAPVRDQNGCVVSYVGSQIDITRQKELERMKDTFVADVSHELRTPTTNISLYLELLENAQLEKQHQYISIIKEQSQQLVKLVEDILDLSRLTRVKIAKGSFSYFDLGLLIEQVVTSLRPLAGGAGIRLQNEAALDLPVFFGEQNQIARLLSNLISNSIRYTPKGYVKVRAFRHDQQVCIEVCDTGIGIDTEDLKHIFDRFYRGKNVRQSKISGTGLGLAIVKEIVELHEGRIEVHSDSNRGTEFIVWLPVRLAESIVMN
jgi:PAS domain S-box-containing protein